MFNEHARKKLLEPLCGDCAKKPADRPYRLKVGDVPLLYEVATNGHVLIAIWAKSSTLPDWPEKHAFISEWLTAKPQKQIGKEDSIAFCTFLKLYECELCPACKGSGERDSSVWGNVEILLEKGLDEFRHTRQMLIDGQGIDGNLLARALNGLNAVNAPIGFRRDDQRFTFFGKDWIVVIMGLKITADDNPEDWPKWESFEEIKDDFDSEC